MYRGAVSHQCIATTCRHKWRGLVFLSITQFAVCAETTMHCPPGRAHLTRGLSGSPQPSLVWPACHSSTRMGSVGLRLGRLAHPVFKSRVFPSQLGGRAADIGHASGPVRRLPTEVSLTGTLGHVFLEVLSFALSQWLQTYFLCRTVSFPS